MSQLDLVGRTIAAVLPVPARDVRCEAWSEPLEDDVVVLLLDNGAVLYPGRGAQANRPGGPGILFGRTPDGHSVTYGPAECSQMERKPAAS